MAIRILIVEDEPLARERVRMLLAGVPGVQVVGEACDGLDAVEAIRREAPDLVFLDVQMPELDGFGVIERVGVDKMPVVIFMTAYDQYALRAFEVNALDYLLKPFDRERFQQALHRAKAHLGSEPGEALNQRLLGLLKDLKGPTRYLERLVVKSSGRISFLKAEEIDCVEACGNYVRLCVGDDEHLLRETMNSLEGKLDPNRFLRIHRSTIVNVECIKELQPSFHGDYVVVLRSGKRLTLSRGYRDRLQELLDNDAP